MVEMQRKRVGLTQEQLALVADVERSYFGGVERSERNITFTVLCGLCAALRCDVAALAGYLPPARVGPKAWLTFFETFV